MENLFQKNKIRLKKLGLIQSIKVAYRATPKVSRFWIYPMNFLFFLMGFLGVMLFIYSSFTDERGGSLVNLLIGLLLIGLSWIIFNGTGKYWMLKSLTEKYFQDFYEKFKSTQLGQQFSFELHASSQSASLVKSFDDRERYYPFIRFLFSKEIGAYTCTIGSMTKSTRPGNVGSPSGYQDNISFLIIEGLPKHYKESKILKRNELIDWFKSELNVDLSILMDYIKLMRVRENRLMLEFKDTIHIAEKKIDVLAYLDEKLQSSRGMKGETLFDQTLNVFEKAEKEEWSLDQLVQFLIKNHSITVYDSVMTHFIKHRQFYLGNLKFEFIRHFDNEPLEIETHYELYFQLSLLDKNGKEISVLREDEIFSGEYVLLFKTPEMNEEVPGLEDAVQLAIKQTLAPLDLEKKGDLLSYIKDEFSKDLSNFHQLGYSEILMYLSLHSKKYQLSPFSDSQIEGIEKQMGVSLPGFYKKFLQVVGTSKKLDPGLINAKDFKMHSDNEGFVFSIDDADTAYFLDLKDDPNQTITYQYLTDNPYGDSPYSTFQTFTEYLVKKIEALESK